MGGVAPSATHYDDSGRGPAEFCVIFDADASATRRIPRLIRSAACMSGRGN
jgi:hypothetical protein